MTKEITAYQSANGELHLSEDAAKSRDEDLLGGALEGLLRLFALDITRTQQYAGVLRAMKNPDALQAAMREALRVLEFGPGSDD